MCACAADSASATLTHPVKALVANASNSSHTKVDALTDRHQPIRSLAPPPKESPTTSSACTPFAETQPREERSGRVQTTPNFLSALTRLPGGPQSPGLSVKKLQTSAVPTRCVPNTRSHSTHQSIIGHTLTLPRLLLLVLSLTLLLSCFPMPCACVQVKDFFPFGRSAGDNSTEKEDDGGSGKINLTVNFPFFGSEYDQLFVNNNGIISFLNELRSYSPMEFPLKSPTPLIAPYWADVDISDEDSGLVWFRQTTDPVVLAQANRELRAHRFSNRNIRAHWVFVVTWEEVGFYGPVGEGRNKRNTFQAVLVVDDTGDRSFVIFNYARLDWTTGSNSLGDENTGLGGTAAQAGFNAGDLENFYEIEDSRKNEILNLTQKSNVNIPGKWIFRVDTAEIEETCPATISSQLSVSPATMSQLGGEVITLEGSCLAEDDIINGTVQPSGERLCCRVLEKTKIRCLAPPVLDTGQRRLQLKVVIAGQVETYSAQILIKNLVDVKPALQRDNPELWRVNDNRELSVSWNGADVDVMFQEATGHRVEVLEYRVFHGKASLITLWTQDFHHDLTNSYRLKLPKSFSRTQMSVAVVRVTALIDFCNGFGPSIFSDVFPVHPLAASDAANQCSAWLTSEANLSPLQSKEDTRCPCTLRQAEGDTAQFSRDPFCRRDSMSILNCRYRPGQAVECILPNRIGSTSSPFTCCYDKSGELLNARVGGDAGGGTLERYSYKKSAVTNGDSNDAGGDGNGNSDNNDSSNASGNPGKGGINQSSATNSSSSGNNFDKGVSTGTSNSSRTSKPGTGGNSGNRTWIDSRHSSHGNSSDGNGSRSGGNHTSHVTVRFRDAFQSNSSSSGSGDHDQWSSSSFYTTTARPTTTAASEYFWETTTSSGDSTDTTTTSTEHDSTRRGNSSTNSFATPSIRPRQRTNNSSSSIDDNPDEFGRTSSNSSSVNNNSDKFARTSNNSSDVNYNPGEFDRTINSNSSSRDVRHRNSSSHSHSSGNDDSSVDPNPPVPARLSSYLADATVSFVPYFSYLQEEIAPRLHCCQFSANQTLCDQYLKYRPPVTCQQYQAPSAAQAAGDPHMETLDGHAYTFNGLGTFTLLKVKDSTAVVQVKATRAKNPEGQFENATVFTGLAMRGSGDNSPILELELTQDNTTLYQIYVDGQLQEKSRVAFLESADSMSGFSFNGNSSFVGEAEMVPVVTSWQTGDMSVVESRLANQRPEVMIVLDDLGLSLLVEVMEELINIIAVASPQLKGKLEGLLGNYNGDSQDDFMSRDSVLVSAKAPMKDIHYRFGMSWQVNQNESLFSQNAFTDFLLGAEALFADEKGEENEFTPVFIDEMELSVKTKRSAVADTDVNTDICEGNAQCAYDLKVTKNENIALSTLNFNKRFEELKSEISPVVRCPYPEGIPNGNRTFTGLKENDTVTFNCYEGYQMDTGGRTRVLMCLNSSSWDAEQPACVRPVDPGEDFPIIIVAIIAAASAVLLIFLLALLIRFVHRKFLHPGSKKSGSSRSSSMDYDQAIELPALFPISDIPSPVFENPLFVQRLEQLSDKGSFQIPRPTYVDPNIYTEFF